MLGVVVNFLDSVSQTISWAVGLISVLSLYCYLSDICFGHETFFRFKSSKLTQHPFRKFVFNNDFHVDEKIKHQKRSLLRGSSGIKAVKTLCNVDDQIFRHILSFLSSKSVIRMGMTSKYYYNLAIDRKIWVNFQQRAFSYQFCDLFIIQRHLDFIEQLKAYPIFLIKQVCRLGSLLENGLYIIIAGSLYEISGLLDIHPGGAAILLEMAGSDATMKFDMACHSNFALHIMKNYLVWSPQKWLE
jgi:hypothetical protein